MPWLTPEAEAGTVYRLLAIPDTFLSQVNGAIEKLTQDYNWEQFGTLTPSECADKMNIMMDGYFEGNWMIGTIHPYASASAPLNMLPCDGSTYNRVDYPLLYAALDAQFVDDADTFHTPDLTDRFVQGGFDNMGDTGGEAEHTLTVEEMPSHSHEIPWQATFPYGDTPEITVEGGLLTTQTGLTGGGQAHNNLPPYTRLPMGIICR
jgi:microcystin-dependent protein